MGRSPIGNQNQTSLDPDRPGSGVRDPAKASEHQVSFCLTFGVPPSITHHHLKPMKTITVDSMSKDEMTSHLADVIDSQDSKLLNLYAERRILWFAVAFFASLTFAF